MGNETSSYLPPVMAARHRLGLPLNGRIALYAGGFAPTHPLDLLVDSAQYIMDRVKVVHFVLMGDGVTRPRLEAEARARALDAALIFVGAVAPADRADFLLACDVGMYVRQSFGSETDSFGIGDVMPFLEAGKPVVAASDMADVRMFVQVNNIGAASPITGEHPQDVADFVKAMVSMLTDDKTRVRRGENARQLARGLTSDTTALGFLKALPRRTAAL
jgi:glycosyltransferase involved in cell wall biosynthesis